MRRRLRRFLAVGAVVTALDLAVLSALALGVGVAPAAADAVAVALAAAVSWVLHRAVTFADDPFVRWVRRPRLFVATAVLGGALDVGVLGAALAVAGGTGAGAGLAAGPGALLAAKALALAVAATVRWAFFRAVLFPEVRRHQAAPAPRPPAPGAVRLSVVLPAYREEDRIAVAVARVGHALAPVAASGGVEVVVVDDGSPDATAARAAAAGARVLRLPRNRGKGAAVRAGVLAARGATVAFTDADLAYDPHHLLGLLAAVEEGFDVAVGCRHPLGPGAAGWRGGGRSLRRLSGRLFNVLTGAVLLGQYRDTQCGLKAFRADAGRLLFTRTRLDGFAFDVELFHLVERYRLSLREVPATEGAAARTSTVRLGLDAARMVRDLLRVRRWAGRGAYDLVPGEGALAGEPTPHPAH